MPPSSKFTTTILPPPGSSISKPRSTPIVEPDAPQTFKDAMTVRTVVFVYEQHCRIEEELDDDDARSWHWVMYAQQQPPPPTPHATTESNGIPPSSEVEASKSDPIGVIRLVPPPHFHEPSDTEEGPGPHSSEPYIKITRVAIRHGYRGQGLSRVLVDTVLDWAANHADELSSALSSGKRWDGLVLVHAQVSVEGLYEKMGFVTDKNIGTWVEENIDHIAMWKRIDVN